MPNGQLVRITTLPTPVVLHCGVRHRLSTLRDNEAALAQLALALHGCFPKKLYLMV